MSALLVVDDDPQALPLVEMALIDAHFERVIEVVCTVTAGLERIKADEHDIYLIDQRCPTAPASTSSMRQEGRHRPSRSS